MVFRTGLHVGIIQNAHIIRYLHQRLSELFLLDYAGHNEHLWLAVSLKPGATKNFQGDRLTDGAGENHLLLEGPIGSTCS